MFKRVLNAVTIAFALSSLLSCSEKRGLEHRIEGLWEVQLYSQRDYEYWYDSCGFMNQIMFFDIDQYKCSLPDIDETLADRANENHKGSWSIGKINSQWTLTINPRKHPLQGVFNISFYKDTVFDSYYNRESIQYFMNLRNKEWNIVCKKSGIIINTW